MRMDWAGSWRLLLTVWGIPSIVIVATAPMRFPGKAPLWVALLVWMGLACLSNARRCGRVHCRYTGPFYLGMAALTALCALNVIPTRDVTWWTVAATTIGGAALIWIVSEAKLGRYR